MSAEGVASDSQEEQVWLWREGDRVAWWSPSARGDLDRARPGRLDLCNLSDLRSGFEQAEIRTELGRKSKLANAVGQILDEGRRVRLRLLRDLSDDDPAYDWTRVPFEWMRWNGEPLHGRLMVERHVPRQAVEPLEPRPLLRGVKVVKRLSAQEDAEFDKAFSPGGCLPRFDEIEVFDEAGSAEEFSDSALDLDRLAALVLVCHGTETDGRSPFRLPDGSEWVLPLDRGMPPLVVLLVCGSDAGNLLSYARDALFLPRSTQTVIVATGKLAVEEAGRFLRRFLEEWANGRAVYEIVRDEHAAVARRPDGLDARRLCVMGRGDLRLDATWGGNRARPWLEMPDAELAELVRNGTDEDAAALTTLVNRSTLMCKLASPPSHYYEDELRRRVGLFPRELLAVLLDDYLATSGKATSRPVQLWKLSAFWLMNALGRRDLQRDRGEEFKDQYSEVIVFPEQGDPGRDPPSFDVEDLPTPIATAWKKVNEALDRQQLSDGQAKLKDAFEVAIRFVASIAVMDLLRSAEESREHTGYRERLIKRVFGPEPARKSREWLDCLRIALRATDAVRQVGELRGLASRDSRSKWMDLMTGDYVGWQDADDYDMRRSPAEMAPRLVARLGQLRGLLEEVSKAWVGWTFKDSHDGIPWHGIAPPTSLHGHGHGHGAGDGPTALVMVHQDGRNLDLSPLITVQHCGQCNRRQIFFFTERRAGTGGAGAEFRDFPERHSRIRSHVPTLDALASKVQPSIGPVRGDAVARAEEEELAFPDIENAEMPQYLHQRLLDACKTDLKARGSGYVHLTGPEGFGKSWFVRMLAEDSHQRLVSVPGQRVLLCRIRALGPNAAAEFIDHICGQARGQGLKEVDEARDLALTRTNPAEQFSTLVNELFELNSLDRLLVVIDGLDELPEPTQPPDVPVAPRRPLRSQAALATADNFLGDDGFAEVSAFDDEQEPPLDPSTALEFDDSTGTVMTQVLEQRFLLDFLPPADLLLSGVFVVLTSRETLGERATERLLQLRTTNAWVEIPLKPDALANYQVVQAYIEKHVSRRALVALIMQRSGGVFLWANHLVRAIVQGAFQEQDDLPEGGDFYRAYLDGLRRREGEERFELVYIRLLLLLAAAKEPVTDAQLVRWGLSESRLRSALGVLRDFYSVHRSPKRYSIKHEGFQRYLKGDTYMAARLAQTHADIADLTFARHAGRWEELDLERDEDRYAIHYLPTHVEAAIKLRQLSDAELASLINGVSALGYVVLERPYQKSFPHAMYLADALLAWAGSGPKTPVALPALGRFAREQALALRRALRPLNQTEAIELIEGSSLAAADKELMLRRVPFVADSIIEMFIRVCYEDPLGIEQVLHGLKKKIDAKGDLKKLHEIVKQEREEIEKSIGAPEAKAEPFAGALRVVKARRAVTLLSAALWRNAARRFLASTFHNRADWLADLDRDGEALVAHDEAAAAFGEAASIRRELVAEGQLAERADLASALDSQGLELAELERHDEAAAAFSEAASIRRELVAEGQPAVRSPLAWSLCKQGEQLIKLERLEEALAAYSEAVSLRRELVAEGQLAERTGLASALHSQGLQLAELKRCDEAAAAFGQESALRDELLAEAPQTECRRSANASHNKGRQLAELQRHDEAAAAFREAITHWRELVEAGKQAERDGLADALGSLGLQLRALRRHDEAAAAFGEAASIRRELTREGQQSERITLAWLLHRQGLALAELKRHDEALAAYSEAIAAYSEAIAIRRELLAEGQQAERGNHALALDSQGLTLGELNRHDEALASYSEAITVRRELVAMGHVTERSYLASSLFHLGFALSRLGRLDEALVAFREAIAVQRELIAERRLKRRPSLALYLNNMGYALRELGRFEDAVDACDESIALRRTLLSEGQFSVRRGLENALGNLGAALTELGRNAEALAAFDEAIAMARDLIVDGPAEAKGDFVWLLRLRGKALLSGGRSADGLASIRQAIEAARGFISAGFKEAREPLADALTDHGEVLLDEADIEGARVSLEEAIAILEELSAEDPRWEPKKELAKALTGYARALDHLGRTEDAQAARGRAAALVQQKPH